MSDHEFVYVMAPDGAKDQSPIKLGITRWPEQRLARCIKEYDHAPETLGFAAVFSVGSRTVAKQIEQTLKDKTRRYAINGGTGEWRSMTGEDVIPFLVRDERCERYTDSFPKPQEEEAQINVPLPQLLHKAFREKTSKEARQMSALMRKWIREYVREGDTTHV